MGPAQHPADPPLLGSPARKGIQLWALWGGIFGGAGVLHCCSEQTGLPFPASLPLCGQEDGDPVQPGAPGATTLPGAGSPAQPPPK